MKQSMEVNEKQDEQRGLVCLNVCAGVFEWFTRVTSKRI